MRLIVESPMWKSEGPVKNERELATAIVAFLKENPEPDDAAIHGLAAALKVDPHEFEEIIYRLLAKKLGKADRIPGGLAAGKPDSDFDPKALAAGIKVEMEHTTSRAVAKEIAKDHLTEDPRYYVKLAEMEKAEQLDLFGRPVKAPAKPVAPKPAPKPAAGPSKGAWQAVPHSIHPGAQRRWVGKRYEYRYPDGKGGWASSPPEQKPAPAAASPAPAGGGPVEIRRSGTKWLAMAGARIVGRGATEQEAKDAAKRAGYQLPGEKPAAPKLVVPVKPREGKPLSGRDEGLVQYTVGEPKKPGEAIPPPPSESPQEASEPVKPLVEPAPEKAPQKGSGEPSKYETTGYVFGSRKELWQRRNELSLEENPAQAYKLVTRDNVLGGKVVAESFAAERMAGTSPGAAAMKFTIFKAIQTRPPDSPEMRETFITAIGQLQNSLAACRTVEDVKLVLTEMDNTVKGYEPAEELTADEMKARGYGALIEDPPKYGTPEYGEWSKRRFEANQKMSENQGGVARYSETADGTYRLYKRASDGVKQATVEQIISLGNGFARLLGYRVSEHGTYLLHSQGKSKKKLYDLVDQIDKLAPESAWKAMLGAKWQKKSSKESRATTREERPAKEGPDYFTILRQRRLGASIRKGGREVSGGASSSEMKKDLGLREVEYGEWVTGKDTGEERQFHTEACHAALFDLADVLGINPTDIGMSRQLTMAFGSRGEGGKGAAIAQYFPDVRVINLTKMWGAGSVAHEWGHAMDHMIHKVYNPGVGKATFASEMAAAPDTKKKNMGFGDVPYDVRSAVQDVMDTMLWTDRPSVEIEKESKQKIRKLKSEYYAERNSEKREELRLAVNEAVKLHNRSARSGSFREPTPWHEAAQVMGPYWSSPSEMFARAFELFVTGQLSARGMVNTYLVTGAAHEPDYPGFYADKAHQGRIDGAMKRLLETLHESKSFQKAMKAFWSNWIQGLLAGPRLVMN